MIAFGHTAIGSLVGLASYELFKTQPPLVGLVATGTIGVVSHYIADFIPHGHFFGHNDYKQKILGAIIFDFLLSYVLFLYVAYLNFSFDLKFWYILFGIGGANLPDVLDGFYYLGFIPKKGILKMENQFHQSMHWHGTWKKGKLIDGLRWGKWDAWQVATVGIALFVLFTTTNL